MRPAARPSIAAALAAIAFAGCSSSDVPAERSAPADPAERLSLAHWSDAARAEALARFASFDQSVGSAVGHEYMIAGTTGSLAVAAGREVLRGDGTAVDAVLTAALAQVALAAQSWVSYAGILTLVVFDPETNAVVSLDAGYAIPRGETEPLTIPSSASAGPTGRMVLVPGFLPGVAAAHERFGRLPFAALFRPAIELAERGGELPREVALMMEHSRAMLAGSEGTRALLLKPDGTCFGAGELFRQAELAATLRAVASSGLDHVRTGPWAERFVERVRAAGGRVALEDLEAYRPTWSEPMRASYHGFEVCAVGAPGTGGVSLVEALNVLAVAELEAMDDPVARLFWWIQATHLQALSFLDQPTRALIFGREIADEQRLTEAWAESLWERMDSGRLPLVRALPGSHSDALVAVDRRGLVAALVHSSNTASGWATGIVVDGICVPDSAGFQQAQIAAAGPGARLPDPTNPALVLRDGKPVLASSSIGAGLHPHTLQRLVAVLDQGLDPAAAMAVPALHLAAWDEQGAATAQVSQGAFDAQLLEDVRALGQPIRELDGGAVLAATGYWVGIRIDPASGRLEGACPARLNGAVFGE